MGLDMYVYSTRSKKPVEEIHKVKMTNELCYWRKHPNLHGWMEELYRERGGEESFNCVYIELFEEDVVNLEKAINEEILPETRGFFFGQSDGEEKQYDLEQVAKMKVQLSKGRRLFYTSWW
ncbi:MAG: phosphoglycerate kinase [Spirochaetia bacterium]|nr:phosphoglycerate kinase [Spirochaetia bacterium]